MTDPHFTDYDAYLFRNGTHYEAYRKMGAHPLCLGGTEGTLFTLWAPNARSVSVIAGRTGWDEGRGVMHRTSQNMWEAFIPGVVRGDNYRYVITGADGVKRYKSDPYAFWSEPRPQNASIVSSLDTYTWNDGEYMERAGRRSREDVLKSPMSIYEVHLGSWKKDYNRHPDGFLNYNELGPQLAEYCEYMGYTHVELMGICEYPFDGSWGYQVTGYFAPTSRHGMPDDFRYLVDCLHRRNIGVIIDWVPAHFPKDDFSLSKFDGTPLYEPQDPLRAEYPEWGTYAFDHGKPEVRSFLISSAFYWIREFHADALRVDAVAAMLYLNYSRKSWRPNIYGDNRNLESMAFLKQMNEAVSGMTHAYLIAEDSSIEKGLTDPCAEDGYGFLFKWNMGWMNDTLKYFGKDPIYRKYHHGELTHTADYAFLENFILVLSHDEVVHLKKSMLSKIPGGTEEKFGGLKALYTFQYTHPGKKLLFMGQEYGEELEWDENRELRWSLESDFGHRDLMQCVRNLTAVYRKYPCLHTDMRDPVTFEWVNRNDGDRNILSYIRRNPWNYDGAVLVVINFSPAGYTDYSCGAPVKGSYRRIFSTYDSLPGGGGPAELGKTPVIFTSDEECDGYKSRITYSLRPYEAVILEIPHDAAGDAKQLHGSAAKEI